MKIYVFAYAAPRGELTRRGHHDQASIHEVVHMLRDGDAQQTILDSLLPDHRGIDTIPNYPPDLFDCLPAQSPELPPGSLILLATRPPMNDDRCLGEYKTIDRSETVLEYKIFSEHGLGRFVEYCSRRQVLLTTQAAQTGKSTEPPLYNEFLMVRGGPLAYRGSSEARKKSVSEKKTVGYLIYLPCIGPGSTGPALLACFGMSGAATLVWGLHLQKATEQNDPVLSLHRIIDANRPRLIVADFAVPQRDGLPKDQRLPPTLRSIITCVPKPTVIIDVELES